jgi:hypothetical protein
VETFVVRAWRSGDDDRLPTGDRDNLRGVVEHVATGTSMPFSDVGELITFLLGRPDGGEGDSEEGADRGPSDQGEGGRSDGG